MIAYQLEEKDECTDLGSVYTTQTPDYSLQGYSQQSTVIQSTNRVKTSGVLGYDDSEYRCLCNTHVHKAVVAISVTGLIFNVVYIILISIFAHEQIYIFIWPGIISFICYILLLVGNRKKISWCYLPFLILNWVATSIIILFAIGCFIYGVLAAQRKLDKEYIENGDYALSSAVGIFMGVFLIIQAIVSMYFFWIALRAFRYLRNVLLNPHSNLPRL